MAGGRHGGKVGVSFLGNGRRRTSGPTLAVPLFQENLLSVGKGGNWKEKKKKKKKKSKKKDRRGPRKAREIGKRVRGIEGHLRKKKSSKWDDKEGYQGTNDNISPNDRTKKKKKGGKSGNRKGRHSMGRSSCGSGPITSKIKACEGKEIKKMD